MPPLVFQPSPPATTSFALPVLGIVHVPLSQFVIVYFIRSPFACASSLVSVLFVQSGRQASQALLASSLLFSFSRRLRPRR